MWDFLDREAIISQNSGLFSIQLDMRSDGALGVVKVETITYQNADVLHCVTLAQMLQRDFYVSLDYQFSNVKINNVGSFETSVSTQQGKSLQFNP